MDKRYLKWKRWISKEIISELHTLYFDRLIFRETTEIIRSNPELPASYFWGFLSRSYGERMIMGVRRQLKIDRSSVNLGTLLKELETYPEVMTRASYVGMFPADGLPDKKYASEEFSKEYALGWGDCLNPSVPSDDYSSLKAACKAIETFADKRIAHYEKQKPKEVPTFGEIDSALSTLELIFTKYYQLFTASSLNGLEPTPSESWQQIFTMRWLPKQEWEQEEEFSKS